MDSNHPTMGSKYHTSNHTAGNRCTTNNLTTGSKCTISSNLTTDSRCTAGSLTTGSRCTTDSKCTAGSSHKVPFHQHQHRKKEKMAALCRHWRMCCCSGNRNCTDRNQTSNQGSDKRRFPYNNGTVYHVSYNGSFRDRASTTGGSRHKNRYDLYGWFRSGKPVSGSFHGY